MGVKRGLQRGMLFFCRDMFVVVGWGRAKGWMDWIEFLYPSPFKDRGAFTSEFGNMLFRCLFVVIWYKKYFLMSSSFLPSFLSFFHSFFYLLVGNFFSFRANARWSIHTSFNGKGRSYWLHFYEFLFDWELRIRKDRPTGIWHLIHDEE